MRRSISRFNLGDAIEVLSKPHQYIHYTNGSYRLFDYETKEDYGYITYKDFEKLNVTEVNFFNQYRSEKYYRF